MKIIFLTLFTNNGASSRVRVFQHLPFLEKEGIGFKTVSIVPDKLRDIWRQPGNYPFIYRCIYQLTYNRVFRFIKYLYVLIKAPQYDVIFIQKILLDVFLFKLLVRRNKNIIYDFDDNILSFPESKGLFSKLRLSYNTRKASCVLKKSKIVLVGNKYLKEYYKNFNSDIVVFPTVINLDLFPLRIWDSMANNKMVIGWVGMGEHHLNYLRLLVSPLLELQHRHSFKFRLIGARGLKEIRDMFSGLEDCEISDWLSPEKIPAELSRMDLAVMPLIEDSAGGWKCALKILEYMAVGIPVVCSPVGVNKDIVANGENGFWAKSKDDWVEKLSVLIENRKLRELFSERGRLTVEKNYSCQNKFSEWLDILCQAKNR